MEIVYKTLGELTPYENNPRNNDNAVEYVKNSIERFGFKVPMVIDKNNVIVAGHTRYKAALELDMAKVPCVVADDLTDDEIRAFRLADNKVAEFAEWDFELRDEELEMISMDMEQFGFDMSEISIDDREAEEDDYDFEKEVEPRTKRGDVFQLGDHRLMCGDSSSEEDVNILTIGGGVYGDMVFTDPPYGVSIGDKNKMLDSFQKAGRVTKNIANDTLPADKLYDLLKKCFTLLREHCKDDASYYVTSPQGGEIGLMMMMMRDSGLEVRHNLIWKKNAATFSMGRLDYDYQHEPIFYTWTKSHHFYGEGYKTTIWEFDKPRKCDLHPTMKPIPLIVEAIKNSTKQGDVVIDIFGGSGSTLIACEETGRKCLMMELDPHYCDVIIDRWEAYTGEKAVKV